jgi:hypothetical protein
MDCSPRPKGGGMTGAPITNADDDARYVAVKATVSTLEPGSVRRGVAESLLNCIAKTYEANFDGNGNSMSPPIAHVVAA